VATSKTWADLGERGGNELAVERRYVEVYGQGSLRALGVGIEDNLRTRGIVGRGHRDQHGLLKGRLLFLGEQRPTTKLKVVVGG
jgi:hypothetical protein